MIVSILREEILNHLNLSRSNIIAICGAADLGKTYMADQLAQAFQEIRISAHFLPLDSFLMDRKERQANNISGYQVEAHDITGIQKALESWQKGEGIEFQLYDHDTGSKQEEVHAIWPSKVLIIEGLFAMHPLLKKHLDYSVFIYTTKAYLKEIKLAADLTKRGYTEAFSKKRYDHEFELYQQNIAPFKAHANCKLYLKEKWEYEIIT